jgi:hypothetical protein
MIYLAETPAQGHVNTSVFSEDGNELFVYEDSRIVGTLTASSLLLLAGSRVTLIDAAQPQQGRSIALPREVTNPRAITTDSSAAVFYILSDDWDLYRWRPQDKSLDLVLTRQELQAKSGLRLAQNMSLSCVLSSDGQRIALGLPSDTVGDFEYSGEAMIECFLLDVQSGELVRAGCGNPVGFVDADVLITGGRDYREPGGIEKIWSINLKSKAETVLGFGAYPTLSGKTVRWLSRREGTVKLRALEVDEVTSAERSAATFLEFRPFAVLYGARQAD